MTAITPPERRLMMQRISGLSWAHLVETLTSAQSQQYDPAS
jgi:hypothetical protein